MGCGANEGVEDADAQYREHCAKLIAQNVAQLVSADDMGRIQAIEGYPLAILAGLQVGAPGGEASAWVLLPTALLGLPLLAHFAVVALRPLEASTEAPRHHVTVDGVEYVPKAEATPTRN